MDKSLKIQQSSEYMGVEAGAAGTSSADYEEYSAVASSINNDSNRHLHQQILELRRRLDDDHQSYKRKLQYYQESQQKQADLVSKLQQKVLQYKTKCHELELNIESKNIEVERMRVSNIIILFLVSSMSLIKFVLFILSNRVNTASTRRARTTAKTSAMSRRFCVA